MAATSRNRAAFLGRLACPALLLAWPSCARGAEAAFTSYGSLPPPASSIASDDNMLLLLELVVNERRSGIIAHVTRRTGRFQIAVDDLRRAGLLIDEDRPALFLDELADLTFEYDAPRQRLLLTALPAMLPAQRLGSSVREFAPAEYDVGALLNYDVHVSGGDGRPVQASLVHEARIFSGHGTLSMTGAFRSGLRQPYIRFDTVWRRTDEATMTTVEVGDFITRSLAWAPAARLGGIQLSRDFSVRPDIVTYPLPEFAGSAALPSTVDLIVGGQRIAGGAVDAGPFALESVPPITGAGKANLVVTDLHGRSIAVALPFYVSSALLRPGLSDFALAFGAFRESYGSRSFDYGGVAGTASLRHGVTPDITLEVRAEIANDMQLAGGGAVVKLGNGGVVSGSYSRSFGAEGAGGELTFGYEYQARSFSLAIRHSRRDADYRDLGLLEREATRRARSISSATLSFALGPAGTVGLGYFAIDSDGGHDSRLANAAWTLPLWNGSRLSASTTHDFEDKGWSGAFSVAIPLGGRRGHLSTAMVEAADGTRSWRADLTRSAPAAGGFGWNASAIRSEGHPLFLRGEMTLRTNPVLLRGGAYGSNGAVGWFGASGSLVAMDGGLFTANRVADAFAVVSTGTAGIPVRYENQLAGRTDAEGRLLIPWASAFYPARYEIDPLGLPANARVSETVRRVAVARGSGHVVRFTVEQLRAARATLVDAAGEPLPAGALVRFVGDDTASPVTHVGWDGLLFLEDLSASDALAIALPDGSRCHVTLPAAAPAAMGDAIIDLGELRCLPIVS